MVNKVRRILFAEAQPEEKSRNRPIRSRLGGVFTSSIMAALQSTESGCVIHYPDVFNEIVSLLSESCISKLKECATGWLTTNKSLNGKLPHRPQKSWPVNHITIH